MVLTTESSKFRFRDSVLRGVNGLPSDLRAMVILRYREQFSYEDIATRLSVSQDGVSSRLCQAVLRLHSKFRMQLDDTPVVTEPVMLSSDCRNVEHYMAQYVDETLSAIHRAGVDSHTSSCPACREKLARYRSVRTLLQSVYRRDPLPDQNVSAPAATPARPTSTVIGTVESAEPLLVDAATAARELQKLFEAESATLPDLAAEEAKLPPPLTPIIPDDLYDTASIVPLATSDLQPVIPEVIGTSTTFVPVPIAASFTTTATAPALVESSPYTPVAPITPVVTHAPIPEPAPLPAPQPISLPVMEPIAEPVAAPATVSAAAASLPTVEPALELVAVDPAVAAAEISSALAATPALPAAPANSLAVPVPGPAEAIVPVPVRIPLRERIRAHVAELRFDRLGREVQRFADGAARRAANHHHKDLPFARRELSRE